MAAAPRMKHNAATAIAVRIDQIGDRRFDAGLTERGDDQVPFPSAISLGIQVLQGAAAANSEMPANRFDPLCARFFNVQEMSPVRLARHGFYLDSLAWQCTGDIDRSVGSLGDSITMLPESVDHQPLNHERPR
jgi:hypothetical protein